jgi:hypothetical protein
MMKEAADKTATLAGDGTTTAIVLTEALVHLIWQGLLVKRRQEKFGTCAINTMRKKHWRWALSIK